MNRFLRSLLPIATTAAALGLAAPGVASAGTYSVHLDTSDSAAGWVFTTAGGFNGCSRAQSPGVCRDADLAQAHAASHLRGG